MAVVNKLVCPSQRYSKITGSPEHKARTLNSCYAAIAEAIGAFMPVSQIIQFCAVLENNMLNRTDTLPQQPTIVRNDFA
ncbi:hypothetical protein [Methylobacterium fujisawaense]|uniref:hypothetical protein n=1 Tax=Methylobacterium fujisawaense TaxID=107400 RepID=UPI002447D90A|nr:hypothetical protein [Methylobacterium fujisawaense]MDH3030149.1 hypothetical protein [Methylobacterium fujisawaense]